jgi:hypothetical protein
MSSHMVTSSPRALLKMDLEKAKGGKKTENAIDSISLKELEKLVKEMIEMNIELVNSKCNIDVNIECICNQICESIAITKVQENLHKIILQFETE